MRILVIRLRIPHFEHLSKQESRFSKMFRNLNRQNLIVHRTLKNILNHNDQRIVVFQKDVRFISCHKSNNFSVTKPNANGKEKVKIVVPYCCYLCNRIYFCFRKERDIGWSPSFVFGCTSNYTNG